jgi:hypothetical protein
MSKTIFVKLDTIGSDAGVGFNIYDSLGNLIIEGESAVNLLAGVDYIVNDNSTWIEIYPAVESPCSNFLHLDYVRLTNNCFSVFYEYTGTNFNISVNSSFPVNTNINFNVNFSITDGVTTATYSVPMQMRANRSLVTTTQTVINNGTVVNQPVAINITPSNDTQYNYVFCPTATVSGTIQGVARRVRVELEIAPVCPVTLVIEGTCDVGGTPTEFSVTVTMLAGETTKFSSNVPGGGIITCIAPNEPPNTYTATSSCQAYVLTVINPCA